MGLCKQAIKGLKDIYGSGEHSLEECVYQKPGTVKLLKVLPDYLFQGLIDSSTNISPREREEPRTVLVVAEVVVTRTGDHMRKINGIFYRTANPTR